MFRYAVVLASALIISAPALAQQPIAPAQEQIVTLHLPPQTVNTIIAGLRKLPWEEANQPLLVIQQQIDAWVAGVTAERAAAVQRAEAEKKKAEEAKKGE